MLAQATPMGTDISSAMAFSSALSSTLDFHAQIPAAESVIGNDPNPVFITVEY